MLDVWSLAMLYYVPIIETERSWSAYRDTMGLRAIVKILLFKAYYQVFYMAFGAIVRLICGPASAVQ